MSELTILIGFISMVITGYIGKMESFVAVGIGLMWVGLSMLYQ